MCIDKFNKHFASIRYDALIKNENPGFTSGTLQTKVCHVGSTRSHKEVR
jgi:hypothetical protein